MDLPERLRALDGPWSNDACRGYLIAALRMAGKSQEEIAQTLNRLHAVFDLLSVEEAKQIWDNFREETT